MPKTYAVEILTPFEVQQLIKACSTRARTGIRNRALIATLYRTGLRISEALALYPKDINSIQGTIRILHGKGDKARTVGVDPATIAMLERWLDVRRAQGINGHHLIFCTLKGAPIKTAYIRTLLPRLAKKAGITKRVHAHGLRHTMASELRQEGTDIGVISKALGHSNIATTARYLDHINPQAVVDNMRTRTWDTTSL